MNWTRVDKYHQTSGAYTVAKCWMQQDQWRYVASTKTERLGVFDTAAQAQARCVRHAEGEG